MYCELMKMSLAPFLRLSLCVLTIGRLHGQDSIAPTELTDAKGRVLKATPTAVVSSNIMVKLENGKTSAIPLKSFDGTTQTKLLQWIAATPSAFTYRFDCKEEEKNRTKAPTKVSKESGEEKERTSEYSFDYGVELDRKSYDVTITNRCPNPIQEIRVCYRIFLDDRVSDLGSRWTQRKLIFKSGNYLLSPLNYNGTTKIETRAHDVHKINAHRSYSSVTERDRLRGVWLKFYRHGVFVGEWKSKIMPKCEWPESSSEVKELERDQAKCRDLIASFQAKPTEAPRVFDIVPASKPTVAVVDTSKPEDEVSEEIKIFDMEDIPQK
jgi:hypothetical protein